MMLLVQAGHSSDSQLKVSITVSPVVLLTVSDGGAMEKSAGGKTEATVKIPLTRSAIYTVSATASGQPSNLGCTLLARLDSPVTIKVTINGKRLSTVEDRPCLGRWHMIRL